MVVLFTLAEAAVKAATTTIAQAVKLLMTSEQLSEKDALKRVARERGMGKSDAYRELQRTRQAG